VKEGQQNQCQDYDSEFALFFSQSMWVGRDLLLSSQAEPIF